MITILFTVAAAAIFHVGSTAASEAITPEPDGSSYHFVSYYSVEIEAPAAEVWAQLVDLGSWMYEFDLPFESGEPEEEPNPHRLTRESPEFQERTRAMWQDRFLGRLKSLVEAP